MRCNNTKYPIEKLEISNDEERVKELQRMEAALMQKEKEIHKKDKILQRKITKFNKRKKNKAKKDLMAASKLRYARQSLLHTLDEKEKAKKFKKCDKHTCKKRFQSHVSDENTENWKTRLEKKLDTCSPVQYFNDLINRPCECSVKKRSATDTDSYLRKLFGRPMTNEHRKTTEHRSCRCPQRTRESYWDRAAGDCYLMTMRRPPQLWLYNRFPRFYPQYLSTRQHCKNCKNVLLIIAAILFWTPCLLCLELCKCCFCTCCTE